jgi:hypothetical protein
MIGTITRKGYRKMSKPSNLYLTYRAMWFEREAEKFLSCGENDKAGALLKRAREYRFRAGELPFDEDNYVAEERMSTCIETHCARCNVCVWIPIWDFHKERNYCYACAMTILGELPHESKSV